MKSLAIMLMIWTVLGVLIYAPPMTTPEVLGLGVVSYLLVEMVKVSDKKA